VGVAAGPDVEWVARLLLISRYHFSCIQVIDMKNPSSRRQPQPPFPPQDLTPPGQESHMEPQPRYEAPAYRAADKLRGRVALVTGGDSGIGRAVAVLFAREGADVALVFLDVECDDARQTREAIEEAGASALLIPGDVSDPGFCRQAVEDTVERFGRLDVLVNNAAYQKHRPSLQDISDEQLEHTFNVNILGYFRMARHAVQHMQPGSAIINTGSITGLEGSAHLLDYSATKGAIHAFTKSLASNLVDQGIRVNCVAPGPVWTPLNPAERSDEEIEQFGADTPMGRPAQPEEVAPAYVFFASGADSGFISGHVLTVLGGDTIAG
jgi:NAD(P)-dependent dehydrogenase (short-subunit alcohol dehydrogenase family)